MYSRIAAASSIDMSPFFTEHGSIDGAISLTDCRGNRQGTLPRREKTTTSGSWT